MEMCTDIAKIKEHNMAIDELASTLSPDQGNKIQAKKLLKI